MGKNKKKPAPKKEGQNPLHAAHQHLKEETKDDSEKKILERAVEIVNKKLKGQPPREKNPSNANNNATDRLIECLASALSASHGSRNPNFSTTGADVVSLSSSPKLPLWSPSSNEASPLSPHNHNGGGVGKAVAAGDVSGTATSTPMQTAGAKKNHGKNVHAHFDLPPHTTADAKSTVAASRGAHNKNKNSSGMDTKMNADNKNKEKKKATREWSAASSPPSVMSMSFSERLYESIGPPAVANATQQLVKPKRNWIIFGLLIIIFGLLWHQKPEMPAGLVVDDPKRPGVLFNKSTIKVRRPVAFIPGFVTSALELWENDECAAPIGSSGTLFRERMFGPQMLLNLLKRPQCYMRQFSLHPQRFGDDPEPFDPSSGRRIRARPAGWLDSGDYFIAGFWVWAKLIRSLADVGYDPNTMLLFPFDWRLNSELAEKRDGYFHRLRDSIEEMYRISNGTKVVVISHSYGGFIKRDFFHWCERFEKGWTNHYIHSSVFIGAPMLGVAKALSALVSGEMRDMTQLPSVPRHILNAYIPRMWRTEMFRSWPCLETMLPRGCDAMWPNVLSLFNQSLTLRASDTFELVETVAEQAGHTCLSDRIKESKKKREELPNLPHAPDMKAFVFYGTGLATESGYAYTIDEDDVGGADAIATKEKGRLSLGPSDILEFASLFSFNRPLPSLFSSNDKSFLEHDKHNRHGEKNLFSSNFKKEPHVYARPSYSTLEAAAEKGLFEKGKIGAATKNGTAAPETKEKEGERKEEGNVAAPEELLTWQEYVSSLSAMVKEVTGKIMDDGIDAVLRMRQPSASSSPSAAAASVEAGKEDNEAINITDAGTNNDTPLQSSTNISNNATRRKKGGGRFSRVASLPHGVLDLPPGSLWRPAFLGSRNTGNALMVDTSLDAQVSERIRSLYKCSSSTADADLSSSSGEEPIAARQSLTLGVNGPLHVEGENVNGSAHQQQQECDYFGPSGGRGGGDMQYHQGVLLGPGDATVPLMSLGFMARSPKGFKKDVGSVITKEFVHLHTAEAHEKLLAVRAERMRRLKELTAAGGVGGSARQQGHDAKLPDLGITTQRVAAESVLPPVATVPPKSGDTATEISTTSATQRQSKTKAASSEVGNLYTFSDYFKRLADINVSRLLETDTSELEAVISGAASTFSAATDVLVEQMKESVKAVLDVRGGKASADHVDLMGNYELITDVLNIVTGNEDLVAERIFTDIDSRIEDLPCYK